METAEEVKRESLYMNAIKHGLVVGVITIILTILAYATSLSFMGSFKFIGCLLLIYIGYVIYAGINYRNSGGKYISYGNAFLHGFIVLTVGSFINFLFGIVLYDVIDPELGAKLSEAIITNTEDTMRNFGAPEDQIDKALAQMRTDLPEGFTLFGRIKNFGTGLIWYAVIVLLTSLVVRKSEPVEM